GAGVGGGEVVVAVDLDGEVGPFAGVFHAVDVGAALPILGVDVLGSAAAVAGDPHVDRYVLSHLGHSTWWVPLDNACPRGHHLKVHTRQSPGAAAHSPGLGRTGRSDMGILNEPDGAGNPQVDKTGSAEQVIREALTEWVDCTEEMLAAHETCERFILHRLTRAGYMVVLRDVMFVDFMQGRSDGYSPRRSRARTRNELSGCAS